MMTIKDLKYKIEKRLQKIQLYNDIYGFQIQPDSKLVNGISRKEIDQLQILFGFDFPLEYREMLLLFSNLDRPTISINPEDESDIEYSEDNFFYQYPEDYEKSRWIIEELNDNKIEAETVLTEAGFDVSKIVGYIPMYYHRVLVVFEDKYLSPVISVWGADIIMFGNNLKEYLRYEFLND
ncbi:hypothetical protein [Flavobacterium collinsii]|uniref:Knr4/Smi1-like domain-containing protein n=1 Tax=Flavobacterium collinsii TaxID=1114861 RepID=A0A9W4TJA5_9FLAO|nr:hypothetical protein [Flavobacterium collinsii]CAI2769091.1 conserved protein of unknown function [Flavobacterium collinsii]